MLRPGVGCSKHDSELVMGEKFGPQLQAASVIHGEQVYRGATDRRSPHDTCPAKRKVLGPPLASGVEQTHDLTAEGIHACEIRALTEITAVTGQREVFDVIAPAVLFSNDMLDVVRKCADRLGEQAILASVIRSAPDKVPRGGVHH